MNRSADSLFEGALGYGRELLADECDALQAFFEANPEYSLLVEGEPPGPERARGLFNAEIPPDWYRQRMWLIGLFDRDDVLVGVVHAIEDLFAPGVWHIGLFVVATALHGTGFAHDAYAALERWMVAAGAHWLRLGVVEINVRATRFWEALGFEVLRAREDVALGAKQHTLLVCMKPIDGAGRADYLERVPRDRADAP